MTTVDDIVALAQENTGLQEFDSDSWREGLTMVMREFDDERLSDRGRESITRQAVNFLSNRLRVHAYVLAHPEVKDERIERPLFILGMPRTGTTVASYLLGQDPARRSLLNWEAVDSAPPPTTATLTTDPRCLAVLEAQQAQLEFMASMKISLPHWEPADGPTECMFVHAQDFKGLLWDSYLPSEDYARWLFATDMHSAYEYEKLVLQVLQSQAPGTWSLKMPSHCIYLDTLLEVFPDARLVWAHRDPFTTLGSFCNLLSLPAGMTLNPESFDKAALGRNCAWQLGVHIERPLATRERIGDDRFFHLHYAEMMRDPLGTMRALYEFAGDELTPETERAMEQYLVEHPQHEHGVAQYTLEEYGIVREELPAVFTEYVETFGIELDPH
ncbi:MAG: sulfotransferase [Acidimicrobiia bacterium]